MLGPASGKPDVSLKAKTVPLRLLRLGRLRAALASESDRPSVLLIFVSSSCSIAVILSRSVLSEDTLNGPDVGKSVVLATEMSLNTVNVNVLA